MNSSFDHDLHNALKRKQPPDGFTERVVGRLPDRHVRGAYVLGAVAAGIALLAAFAGLEEKVHEHQMHAEREQRQVLFALSLASEKLDHAMNRANLRLQRSAPDVTIGISERGRL